MNLAAAIESNSSATAQTARQDIGRESSGTSHATRALTDDEILGLGSRSRIRRRVASTGDFAEREEGGTHSDPAEAADPWDESLVQTGKEEIPASYDAASDSPELQQLRNDANAYKEAFATPGEAQAAKARLSNVEVLDNLFFPRRPEDHAELVRIVAQMDPISFELLTAAISHFDRQSTTAGRSSGEDSPTHSAKELLQSSGGRKAQVANEQAASTTAAQQQFLHEANGAAVKGVLDAIESQVDRVLPEGISRTARSRLVGEIYREVEQVLESSGEFGRQIRTSIVSGDFGAKHRDAIVSLITSRARQALPAATKRVVDEWTSTMVAAHRDRRAKQRNAESRIDIGGTRGSSNEGRKPHSPRDIDYRRMSDSDILNL